MSDQFVIANRRFSSRLLLGTGKFASPLLMKEAIDASGSEIITVALRRVDLETPQEDPFVDIIDPKNTVFLSNTSGARTAEEAVRLARIAKFSEVSNWVKVEVTP